MKPLACIHLVLIGYGLYLMVATEKNIYHNSSEPLPWPYGIMVVLNLLFMSLLLYAAILLWKRRSLGLKISLAVFAAEIFYFFAVGAIWAFGGPLAMPVAAATGIGNMGIAPQELCGYPVIGGAIAAILLFRSRQRQAVAAA